MAEKTATKSKVKNGIDKTSPVISMAQVDDILLRLDKTEKDVDNFIATLDSYGLKVNDMSRRVAKCESRLGID